MMINIHRWLNEIYLYNRLGSKDIFYITIIIIIIIFFNVTSIIWSITFIIFIWILTKIYNIKKKHVDEEELDIYCKKDSIDPRCKIFNNAKLNYNKIINNINNTL